MLKLLRVGQHKDEACRVPTGQGKWEKVKEFEWSGKGQGKYFLEKSWKMKIIDKATVKLLIEAPGFYWN